MYDTLIKNAVIIDGSGGKRYPGDVLIHKGKIKDVGRLENVQAQRTVDAHGLCVSPGFIDLNNHSDGYLTLFTAPNLESMLKQGVTTILGGNCGSSLAPLVSSDVIKTVQRWADIKQINLNWLTFNEFLKELSKKDLGVNFGSLIGHTTLRRGILGDSFRSLKKKELGMIKDLLKGALEQGGFGLSTGLAYSHAKVASTKEIIELAKTVEEHNCIYTTHVRGEAEELIPAIKEAIEVAEKTEVSLEISHLKAMGEMFWPNMDKAIDLIEKAKKRGLDINFDVYPYTTTGSVLYILLPDWVAEGGKEMLLKRLMDKKIRRRVVKEMQENQDYEYDKIIVASSPIDNSFIGRSVVEIAQSQNTSVEEAIINMLIASDGRIITFLKTLSEENVEKAMSHDLSFVASDGFGCNMEYFRKKRGLVHPRCFGAFPRFIGRYARDKNLMSVEKAINKITSGPAHKLKLEKRGLIKKDYWADLVLFDLNKIVDKATFGNPFQYPAGIEYVLVNGVFAVEKGALTNKRAGQLLRKI